MRVVATADLLVVVVVVDTLVVGGVDAGRGVVVVAAGGGGLSGFEDVGLDGGDGSGEGAGCEEQSGGEEGELHFGRLLGGGDGWRRWMKVLLAWLLWMVVVMSLLQRKIFNRRNETIYLYLTTNDHRHDYSKHPPSSYYVQQS